MPDWTIDKLADTHDRTAFSCGKAPLDDFLHKYAAQYQKRDLARTYVALRLPDPKVLGYYTLSSGAVDLSVLPDEVRKKLPRTSCACRVAWSSGRGFDRAADNAWGKRSCSMRCGAAVPWPTNWGSSRSRFMRLMRMPFGSIQSMAFWRYSMIQLTSISPSRQFGAWHCEKDQVRGSIAWSHRLTPSLSWCHASAWVER